MFFFSKKKRKKLPPLPPHQDKPKVDVHQVPIPRDHDVAVVPVLGVEQVAGDGVAGVDVLKCFELKCCFELRCRGERNEKKNSCSFLLFLVFSSPTLPRQKS